MTTNIFEQLKLGSRKVVTDTPDMGRCSSCDTTMKLSECIHDYGHHDGWEMPAYTELLCPHCTDGGCVDDVWYSEEKMILLEGEKRLP